MMPVFIALIAVPTLVFADGKSPLDQLASSVENNPAALTELGDLYVEAVRLDEAKQSYQKALRLNSKYVEAELGLVRITIAKGVFRTAKHKCRKLEEKAKKKSTSEICSGSFWLANERSSRAVDEFEKAIAKGDVVRGKTGLGEAMRLRGDQEKAIEYYREALAAGAGYLALLGLGQSLEFKGDIVEAKQALAKAVAKQPASCLAHYHYGRLLGSGAKAEQELEVAISIRPNWVEAYLALGSAYQKSNKLEKATEAYQAALKGDTNQGLALYGLGKALHGLGKEREAADALKKAVELIPNNVDALMLLADIQYASGENAEAIDVLEKARNAAPGEISVYMHSGEVFFRMGRFTSARTFLSQAITMNPKLSLAHALLGDIACSRRLYESGREHYQKALSGDQVGIDAGEIRAKQSQCKPKR
jgi:tetratricopeptide (TPR) repeat protein